MRFLRHLVAASLVVAVVVIIGLAWNHFAASTLIGSVPGQGAGFGTGPEPGAGPGGPAGARPRNVIVSPRGIRPGAPHGPVAFRTGGFDLGLSSMLEPVNWPYLRHTVVIETAVMAAVVIIDVSRRRSRRASRAARLAGPPSAGDDGPSAGAVRPADPG